MKVSKNCGTPKNQSCASDKIYKNMDNSNWVSLNTDGYYKFITADGTSVYFYIDNITSAIYIDIDGFQKGKNTYGIDFFQFALNESRNSIEPKRASNFSDYLTNLINRGYMASGWVIDYDNMDYLKLTKDKKCPNGKTPTEQNPRCK